MNRPILILALTTLAMLGVAAPQPLYAGEAPAADGTPLGNTVAATEEAYSKGVTLPSFTLNGVALKQDRSKPIPDDFKNVAARKCKPFCVQPATIEGAVTFKMEDFPKAAAEINGGKILIVDMRTPDWFEKGTLPGALNLPYSDLTAGETKAKVKVKKLEGKEIIAFCNGWWCGQSPTGIKALKDLGYTGKVHWFRGGNQDWVDAGLPLVKP
ncbi:MAG: rhodanese-like domain-containing protein [Magnetococcales bacterium]|nr:rhodanese-like domain-containing protein [Magnetococcales bacterium]